MARQYQLDNGTYVNETTAFEYQIASGTYVNETVAAAAAGATVESRILHSAMAGSSVGPGSSFVHAGAGRAATY